jgi:hypothetical protein
MPNDTSDRVHRDLVTNLDDDEALQKLQHGWLASEEWAQAIERVRTTRFGERSVAEGNMLVGRLLGERFFASNEGMLVRVTIDAMPRQDLFGKLLPMIGERLRQSIRFEWVPSDGGGLLRVRGRRATPPEVTLGFMLALAAIMPPPPSITVESVDEELLVFRVDGL